MDACKREPASRVLRRPRPLSFALPARAHFLIG